MTRNRYSLEKVWQEAESHPTSVPLEKIHRLSKSKDDRTRLLSLFLVRRRIREGNSATVYFPLAESMLHDSNTDCRWQAAIVIGESIETDPDAVWQIVRRYGDSKDRDMRSAMACVLLEHLFERDFKRYFTLLRQEVAKGRRRFLDTLGICSFFGENAANQRKRVAEYLRKATDERAGEKRSSS